MATLHPMVETRARQFISRSPFAGQAARILAVARPVLEIYRAGGTPTSARSWVGGRPALPADVPWPTWDPTEPVRNSIAVIERKVAEYDTETSPLRRMIDPRPGILRRRDRLITTLSHVPRPLHFLAQFDLSETDALTTASVDLPDHGTLWLFQDAELIYSRFCQSWRVIYVPEPGPLIERQEPELIEPFVRAAVCLRPGVDIPFNLGQPLTSPTDDEGELYDLRVAIDAQLDAAVNIGSIGGTSQDEEWCQPRVFRNATLAHGVNAADRWPELVEASRSWSCLLDLATDKDRDPRWLWGDVGSLTYWLSAEDRRDRAFGNAWLYLDTT